MLFAAGLLFGILISALTLGERLGASLIAGLLLIATGIRLVTLRGRSSIRGSPALTCRGRSVTLASPHQSQGP